MCIDGYCLNFSFKHGVARITILEKGTDVKWRPLVYSDLPNDAAVGNTVFFLLLVVRSHSTKYQVLHNSFPGN